MEKKISEPKSCKNEQNTQINSKDEVLKELENNLIDFDPNCKYSLNGLKQFEALRINMLNEKYEFNCNNNNNNNFLNNKDESYSSLLFEQDEMTTLKKDYPYESEEFNLNGVFDIKKKISSFCNKIKQLAYEYPQHFDFIIEKEKNLTKIIIRKDEKVYQYAFQY